MLSVTNTLSIGTRYSLSDSRGAQSAPMVEINTGSSFELNTKDLKELINRMVAPNVNKLDAIMATLIQHGAKDTSNSDFATLSAAIGCLAPAKKNADPSDNEADILANQQQQVEKMESALPSDNEADILANQQQQVEQIEPTFSLDDVLDIFAKQQQQVEKTASALDTIKNVVMSKNTTTKGLVTAFNAKVKAVQEASSLADTNKNAKITIHSSYADLWATMALSIKNIKTDYVDFYADLMQKYTEMYEAFNTNVQGASTNAVSAGDDGNNVKFDTSKMNSGYNNFSNAVKGINLGSVQGWAQMTTEERNTMVTTLEPAFKVDSNGKISFNLDQYNSAPKQPAGVSGGKVSTASYQAWLASFNASGSAFQSNMQSFAQRYSQANSTFDNLNKVLSGAISSLADSARDTIKSFG